MFRFIVAVLAVAGVVALVSGGISGAEIGVGVLLIPVLFFAKLAFIVLFWGAIWRMFWHRSRDFGEGAGPRWGGGPRPSRRPENPARSPEQSFEEWHRMAHAKEEVDSWAPPFPDTGENA
jgi:hypothetical protein